jgi:hypothetical protein
MSSGIWDRAGAGAGGTCESRNRKKMTGALGTSGLDTGQGWKRFQLCPEVFLEAPYFRRNRLRMGNWLDQTTYFPRVRV